MTSSKDQKFVDRLNQHPKLRDRVKSLLNVVENEAGDCTKADDAEQAIFEYIEVFYNRERIHSANDYMSPVDYEIQQKAV